jgi:ligand-binding sensor domain-containing protein
MQDSRGFYWIGTADGLNRFDGGRFTRYFHDESKPETICGDLITNVVERGTDILVGTQSGISLFHPESNSFSTVYNAPETSTGEQSIGSIQCDKLGNTWVFFRHDWCLLDANFKEIRCTRSEQKSVGDIYSVRFDAEGNLWINISGKLNKIDVAQGYSITNASNSNHPMFHVSIADFDFDASGNIVVADANEGNILFYQGMHELDRTISAPLKNGINWVRLFCMPSGKIWLRSLDDGLFCLLNGNWIHRQVTHDSSNPQSICNDDIPEIMEDSYGNTWFCSDGGLDVLFKSRLNVQYVFELPKEEVSKGAPALLTAQASDSAHIWITTWGKGLAAIHKADGTCSFYAPNNSKNDLYMNDIGKYAGIDDLFLRLKATIDLEIQYQTNLFQIIGTLETIFSAQNNVTK